jgi:hypothetical protein
MEIAEAQSELRNAYVHGGPGTLISGIVWLVAAITELNTNVATGFIVLFFGGMFIFPAAKLVVQGLFRRQPESKQNPGGLTVVETLFPMISGLFTAWLILPDHPEFVFSIAAISVGAHYFGFRTAYGDWTFWGLGATMCTIGLTSILFAIPPRAMVAFAIAGTEVAFGFWLLFVDYQKQASRSTSDQSTRTV